MKHGHAWAIGLLALTLSACGGSHHHDDSSTVVTTTGPGLTSDYRIEAVLSDTTLDPDYIYQDPLDLQVLDNVQFQLVNYPGGTADSRHVAPTVGSTTEAAVSFATNDTLNRAGVLTSGGSFTASGTDSGATSYVVSATYNGNTYTTSYHTSPRLNSTRVRGKVLDETNGGGVYNAEVDFYGPRNSVSTRNVVLATVRTGPDGTFRATVPLPSDVASGGTVDLSFTVRQPVGYNGSFDYAGSTYVTDGTDRPPLTLSAGDYYFDTSTEIGLTSGSATADLSKKASKK